MMVESAELVIPLIRMGAFFCGTIVLLTGLVGGYLAWKNQYDASEMVSRLMTVFMVVTVSLFIPVSIFAFLGFVLDAVLGTGYLVAQLGGAVGVVPGLLFMRWLFPRVTL